MWSGCSRPDAAQELKRAEFKASETACFGGELPSCSELARRYETGQGTDADVVKAGVLYEESCRGGDQPACGRLGRMLRLGIGMPKDERRAADLLSVACRSGDMPACVQWGVLRRCTAGWLRLTGQQEHQKAAVLWLTGLSGAGKSTIANIIEKKLTASGHHTFLLDGDNVRHGLNKDLGFTDADRDRKSTRLNSSH